MTERSRSAGDDGLSHVDGEGRAKMVDVGGKNAQRRTARATGVIRLNAATPAAVRDKDRKSVG